MTPKGSTQKPKHPPVKNYADYLQDAVDKGEMTAKERSMIIAQNKSGYMFYNKKTYIIHK